MEKHAKNLLAEHPARPLSTAELAEGALVKEQSVRKRYCLTGSYFSIKPEKLANGRLRWPADAIEKLAKNGGAK